MVVELELTMSFALTTTLGLYLIRCGPFEANQLNCKYRSLIGYTDLIQLEMLSKRANSTDSWIMKPIKVSCDQWVKGTNLTKCILFLIAGSGEVNGFAYLRATKRDSRVLMSSANTTVRKFSLSYEMMFVETDPSVVLFAWFVRILHIVLAEKLISIYVVWEIK